MAKTLRKRQARLHSRLQAWRVMADESGYTIIDDKRIKTTTGRTYRRPGSLKK